MPMSKLRVFLVGLLFPAFAFGWNAGGHRLVAAIAWHELGAGERTVVTTLLDMHPEARRWERRGALGEDRAWILFSEASTWADDIRQDRRFFDRGTEPETPPLEGYPDMARQRTWHYLNLPVGEMRRHTPARGELDRQILGLALTLANGAESQANRAYALVWLIHLVGDIHQPLHVATRSDPDGGDDAGGNGLPVFDPDGRRRSETNLHAWWDDLAAPPWLRGSRLRAAAHALRRTVRAETVGSAQDVDRWRDESLVLARDVAYSGVGASFTIDDAYRQQARRVAGERVALAGVRLGRLLKELLQP